MPLSTTEFATAMKEFYLGPLNDQVYRAHVILDRLTKNSEDVEGRYAYVPLISGRNVAVGSRVDGATGAAGTAATAPKIPEAGRQSYNSATFLMGYHYGRGSISGPVMRASKSNAGAFAKALDIEMKGLLKSLPEDLNRQLWSYGHGRGATIGADNAGGSVTVTCRNDSTFNLKVGDRVHISPISAGAAFYPAAGTTVASITRDANATQHTVILSATSFNTFTAATDAVYFGAQTGNISAEDSSRAQEMYGIPAAIDDGDIGADEGVAAVAAEFATASLNYGGIDRDLTFWRSQVLKNPAGAGTNRPLTVTLLEQAWLTAINVGGADAKMIDMYTTPGIWATFGLLHIGDRRYNDYKETLKGGWEALMFNGRPVMYDRDAPRDIIWYLDMESLMLLTSSGYQMMDEDGSVLSRVPNRDEYEFTLFRDAQLGCNNPSLSVRLDDITAAFNIEG